MSTTLSKREEFLKEELNELLAFSSIGVIVTKMIMEAKSANSEKEIQEIHYLNLERHKSFVENVFSPKEKKRVTELVTTGE